MFSKHLRRLLVLGVVMGCLTATAASASAATVTVSPGGAVTGTGGAVQFVFHTARRTLNCTTFGFTATLFSASGTYPITISNNLQFFCTGGRIVGGVGITMACSATARLNVTGSTSGGITPITITNISCTVTITGSSPPCSVRITGSVTGSYNNANSTLTINATGGSSLAATGSSNGSGGTCSLLPNDSSVWLTNSTGGNATFQVSPATTITAT